MPTDTEARQERVVLPPYVAFTTFKNFVKSLSENGLPSHVDKSVMNGLSGGVQGHLASAIRFLGLVEDDLTPTSALKNLVDAFGTEDWRITLSLLIKDSYGKLINGVDLKNVTPDKLDKCFEKDSKSAVMIDRTVRFFLSALDDSGIEYSTHLKKRKPKAKRIPRQVKSKPTKKDAPMDEENVDEKNKLPTGMFEYPIHFSGDRSGHIRVPKDISIEDCEMIELLIPMLKMLAERNSK